MFGSVDLLKQFYVSEVPTYHSHSFLLLMTVTPIIRTIDAHVLSSSGKRLTMANHPNMN